MVDIYLSSYAPQQPMTAPSTEQSRNADSEPDPQAREDRIEIQQQVVELEERREDTENMRMDWDVK